jgi:integrase
VGLVRLPSGYWGIRWGRALARRADLPLIESTQTRDRHEAAKMLDRRRIEVFRSLGDDARAEAVLRQVAPIGMADLVSDFLREYRAGNLPGRKPSPGTVDLCVGHLLGARGGLVAFATAQCRRQSHQLDVVLVTRWLEAESRRLSNDSLRLKLIAARNLARYAHGRGFVRAEALTAILALRPPPAARGRAQVDGVPAMDEVERLLQQLKPRRSTDVGMPWHKLAELQLRLGLRRAEVLALDESWLDPVKNQVVVRVSASFDTKSHASREIDGVDGVTFALAREVIALKRKHNATASGYREAWKRAVARLEKAGSPWHYRNKSHALRSVYATMSRLAGIPLTVVRDRLGHSSEHVTERHYLGRMTQRVPGPFADRELLTRTQEAATVLPLPISRVG